MIGWKFKSTLVKRLTRFCKESDSDSIKALDEIYQKDAVFKFLSVNCMLYGFVLFVTYPNFIPFSMYTHKRENTKMMDKTAKSDLIKRLSWTVFCDRGFFYRNNYDLFGALITRVQTYFRPQGVPMRQIEVWGSK